MRNINQELTDSVTEMLKSGIVPWRKPWQGAGKPANFASKRNYHGINTWLLNAKAIDKDYKSNYWMTYKQAQDNKGQVRKNEKGAEIIFWSILEKPDADNPSKIKKIPLMRLSYVFNLSQIDGIELPNVSTPNGANSILSADDIVKNMLDKPEIIHRMQDKAYYMPSADKIYMPEMTQFYSTNGYYGTLFHELAHSTGNENRLKRFTSGTTSHEEYSKEELIAEMTSTLILNDLNMLDNEEMTQSASYLANWTMALQNDISLLVKAGTNAQKAYDFILNKKESAEN
jgi:antirestriction protein ArdC